MLVGHLQRFVNSVNMVYCPQGVIELDPYERFLSSLVKLYLIIFRTCERRIQFFDEEVRHAL